MNLKKFTGLITIVVGSLLMTVSCLESDNVQKQTTVPYSFDGTEGGAITLEVATQWINNYATQNQSGANAHFFGQDVIKKLLSSDGAMGIRIYYSISDLNNRELLLTGADGRGNDLVKTYGVKGVVSKAELMGSGGESFRGTEGGSISVDVAKQWVANYRSQNQQRTQAHFFGHEIINQILAEKNCAGIRIYYALNDSGVPQLLLVGVRKGGSNILPGAGFGAASRTKLDSAVIADMSFPCPTHCTGT